MRDFNENESVVSQNRRERKRKESFILIKEHPNGLLAMLMHSNIILI